MRERERKRKRESTSAYTFLKWTTILKGQKRIQKRFVSTYKEKSELEDNKK